MEEILAQRFWRKVFTVFRKLYSKMMDTEGRTIRSPKISFVKLYRKTISNIF